MPKKDQHLVPHADGWAVNGYIFEGTPEQIERMGQRFSPNTALSHSSTPSTDRPTRSDVDGLRRPDTIGNLTISKGIQPCPFTATISKT